MATATSRTAIAAAPAARSRSVRRLCAAAAATGSASHTTVSARLAQQLRQLRQFKVWDAPAAAAASRTQAHARGARQPDAARQLAPGDGAARPGAGGARKPGIVWFRADLRLHDHEALTRAQAESSSLLPVYCFDPRDYGKSPQGYDRTGPYRAQFLAQAVADLRARLRAAGSELLVRVGRPEDVISELVRQTGAGAVYCHTEVTFEELQVESAVKSAAEGAGARLNAYWCNTLCHLEDLPYKLAQLPQNFDKFREQTESAAVRAALPPPAELRGLPLGGRLDPGKIPTLQQLGLKPLPTGCGGAGGGVRSKATAVLPALAGMRMAAKNGGGSGGGDSSSGSTPPGGESEALSQLHRFLAHASAAGGGGRPAAAAGAAYGSNFSASIAPWLATGCLSARKMLEDAQHALAGGSSSSGAAAAVAASPALQAQQQQPRQQQQQQPPLSWVRFELLWRDFFRFMTLKYSSLSAGHLGSSSSSRGAGAAVATRAATPVLAMA